jgi:hypothetical protein
MIPEREFKALLHALQKLYTSISSLVLHKRMDSYREEAGNPADRDLGTLISDHIDRLSVTEPENSDKTQSQASLHGAPAATRNPSRGRRHSTHKVSIVSRAFNGLGRYFRSNRKGSVLDPQLSEKLKQSTWNHVHTALRLARQGEAVNAKLHLDIASQALKEAAHYMSREEHIAFTVAVEEKLGEITGHGMGADV